MLICLHFISFHSVLVCIFKGFYDVSLYWSVHKFKYSKHSEEFLHCPCFPHSHFLGHCSEPLSFRSHTEGLGQFSITLSVCLLLEFHLHRFPILLAQLFPSYFLSTKVWVLSAQLLPFNLHVEDREEARVT